MANPIMWTQCKRCGRWERRPPSVPCGCGSRAKEPAAVSSAPPVVQAADTVRIERADVEELVKLLDFLEVVTGPPARKQTIASLSKRLRYRLEDSHAGE